MPGGVFRNLVPRCVLFALCFYLVTVNVVSADPIRAPRPRSDATATPTQPVPPPTLTPTPVLTTEPLTDPLLTRPKPESAPFDNPNGIVKKTPTPTPVSGPPRLDDSVLRWLPEILAAAKTTGVPPELIAAMIRIESTGDPNVISPAGARGLMQAMPDQLASVGFPESTWHDPASNILAGSWLLINRLASYGNWDDAIGSYFGFGCDIWGTCTAVYVAVVWSWASYYAPIIANPLASGFGILPPGWLPPTVAPYVRPGPPSTATPTPKSPTPTPSKTNTPAPGDEETPSPTTPPGNVPTAVPTTVPSAVPTEVPTEIPTAVPTLVPTEPPPPPTEPPPPPTEPPPPPPEETPPSS